jgi:AraC-like DNA-binding protein
MRHSLQVWVRFGSGKPGQRTEEFDAATAAFEVGYESPTQFNREYKRFFGNPPMRGGHVPDSVFERAQAHFNEQELIALGLP